MAVLRWMEMAWIGLRCLRGWRWRGGVEEVLKAGGTAMPRVEIKWPNDLLVGGKKVAGILVERRGGERGGGGGATVIGIGINVRREPGDFPEEFAEKATSLYLAGGAAGRMVDRLRVVAAVLPWVERYCAGAKEGEGWVEEWKGRCSMLGTRVRASRGEESIVVGEVLDVDPLQGLVLRDEAGGTHFLCADDDAAGVTVAKVSI